MTSDGKLLLGLDIGTLAVKGVIVDTAGRLIARASVERGPTHPHPGWVEMDAERDWWGCGLTVIREMLAVEDVEPRRVAGIGVCGLVPCLCPLSQDGHPLRPAILYADNRALGELAWVNQQADLALSAEAVVPKLVWLKRYEPVVFAGAHTILSAHNYTVYRLTGRASMDYDTASIVGGVFDGATKTWDAETCRRLELPPNILPPLLPATGAVGTVAEEAARVTGLAPGTPVITGSGDTFPTMVGCGAVEPGDAMISFGTTGLLTITDRPLAESAAGPHFESVGGGGAVTWGANVLSAGRLVRWYRDQFGAAEVVVAGRTGDDEYALLDAGAAQVPPGSEGLIVLPHLLGRRTPTPDATMRGSILGLSPSHTAAHVYRAILESFAYNVRQRFDTLRDRIERVVATAGGARSRLWRQIMADVLDTPLAYHPRSGGALGIAFLTGYGLGLIDDFNRIKTQWLRGPEIVRPDPMAHAEYDRLFSVYCEFDEVLAEPFAHLAAVGGQVGSRG
ncbi:MAG: Xylulose kinase [Anaerolineales bacterium]|nr:Xylulose kinase [Anaerolineales bacterium]